MRSVRGCLSCRQKRRKCDELRPACSRCERSGRPCRYSGLVLKQHINIRSFYVDHGRSPTLYDATRPDQKTRNHGPPFARVDTTDEAVASVVGDFIDPVTAYLFQHFSAKPGKWLDLYCLYPHFSRDVPRKARRNSLLRNSVCAYAAKHLHRTRYSPKRVRLPLVGTSHACRTDDDVALEAIAAEYYGQAIAELRLKLQSHTESERSGGLAEDRVKNIDIDDEILAAMAILCCYEYMSASDTDWLQHLSGTMLMLELQRAKVDPTVDVSLVPTKFSIFWNFARQDLYGAFISGSRTRLNTEDLAMWRAAGVRVRSDGIIADFNTCGATPMGDDMISNTLLWLFCKIANVLSDCQHRPEQDDAHYIHRWERLEREVDEWYTNLPPQFEPVCRSDLYATESSSESSEPVCVRAAFPNIWYSSKICGSTMQTYHLLRVLLSTRCLQRRSQSVHRHGEVPELNKAEQRAATHSYEIFGIAMSSPEEACIYLHQTQTLFVAGQYLINANERAVVIDLLERVQTELGWATDYRIQDLKRLWADSEVSVI